MLGYLAAPPEHASLESMRNMVGCVHTLQWELPMRYQLESPAIALIAQDNQHRTTRLAAGEIVNVLGHTTDRRLLLVSNRNEQFLMFETHLNEHGKRILFKTA